jgi:hypothetical protein
MFVGSLRVTVLLLALITVSACGGDNLSLCDGCGTPTPTLTLTPTPTPTATTATPAVTATP